MKNPSPRSFPRLSVFVTIVTVFFVVVSLTSAIIAIANYAQTRSAAIEVATNTFDSAIVRLNEQRIAFFSPVNLFVELYSEHPAVKSGGRASSSIIQSVIQGLSLNPHISSVYVGYENGDYLQVLSLDDRRNIIALIDGPPETRYAVQAIRQGDDGVRVQTFTFYDNNRREIGSYSKDSPAYDPRSRGWYQDARAHPDRVVRTAPYAFDEAARLGLTLATAFDGAQGGAVGVDVTLTQLSEFLQAIRPNANHHIIAFDDGGPLIAHPDPTKILKSVETADGIAFESSSITELDDPVIREVTRRFGQKGPFGVESMDIGGEEYLGSVVHQHEGVQRDHYILYAAPRAEFEGDLAGAAARNLIPGLLILLLATPVIVYLARMISRPLTELAGESELIRSFKLDKPITMSSPVREIDALITSMTGMKKTLREISKFVPKALVKDILDSESVVRVGGQTRRVSLLLTDVKDFTPISDKTPPEELMVHMSEYFEELASLIIKENGTIDKFVGDAIFSYWNAPIPVENYERAACLAALKCRNASERLSTRWVSNGRLPWHTRFGVHAEEVVVGNVGSSDRIDYTVIGGAVGTAARLEGLNKYYGTRILVSGQIAEACSDEFLFRRIDRCLFKESGEPVDIYELLGRFEGTDDLRIVSAQSALVADWSKVYEVYESRNWFKALDVCEGFAEKYPADGVAQIYLDRIIEFLVEPPSNDWDGVMNFTKK